MVTVSSWCFTAASVAEDVPIVQLPQWLGDLMGKSPSNLHGNMNGGCPAAERDRTGDLSVFLGPDPAAFAAV